MNFWINLDPMRELSSINMDFADDSDATWEFVMI
jgi:hypothetical protein